MLRGKRIGLTFLTEDDLPLMLAWINDREIVKYNAPFKPIHSLQHRLWFESIMKRNDLLIFAIRLLKNGELIGSCQLHNIEYIHRTAELQIRLGPTLKRDLGYGSEAINLLLQFAFRDVNLNRVYLHVFISNSRAIHVYEKAGFVKEGLMRQAAYINGSYIDIVLMGILREEYEG